MLSVIRFLVRGLTNPARQTNRPIRRHGKELRRQMLDETETYLNRRLSPVRRRASRRQLADGGLRR